MTTVQELIDQGILRYAREPKGNPMTLDFPQYTLHLFGEDYPARTPVMWNAAYQKFGLGAGAVMFIARPENLPEIIAAFRGDSKYLGGAAGVGLKEKILDYLDRVDTAAEIIGSVNFVRREKDKFIGYNTDGLGYARSLGQVFEERGEGLRDKKAVILGAGGTGNAVAFALVGRGMQVVILNRTVARAQVLAQKINEHYYGRPQVHRVRFGGEELVESEVKNADAIINVSLKGAVGELEHYCALAPAQLPATNENISQNLEAAKKILAGISPQAVISDIVIKRELTPLLQLAKEAGFTILDGIPMVINQGAEAFWLLHSEELKAKGINNLEDVLKAMKEAANYNNRH